MLGIKQKPGAMANKKLLILNQYYTPELASSGQLLGELCESLASQFDIHIIAGTPSYSVEKTVQGGNLEAPGGRIKVWRVPNTTFARSNMLGRLSNYFTFLLGAASAAIVAPSPDVVITMTDPPIIGLAGGLVAMLHRRPFVLILQDIHPDAGIAIGKINHPLLIRLTVAMRDLQLSMSKKLVAIGQNMAGRLIEAGVETEKIEVIENWIDTDRVVPLPRDNAFARRHGLVDKFVVMHSGNVGLIQGLEVMIEAAALLRQRPSFQFVIIGDGAKKAQLMARAAELKLENILFLPYQDKKDLKYSLSSADLHLISLEPSMTGILLPSKLYGILAVGRPIVAALDQDNEIAALIKKYELGAVGPPQDAAALARNISQLARRKKFRREAGVRARALVEEKYSRQKAISKYGRLFCELSKR